MLGENIYNENHNNKSQIATKTIGPYILEKTLGQGTFGKVKLGVHLLTREKVKSTVILGCNKNPRER